MVDPELLQAALDQTNGKISSVPDGIAERGYSGSTWNTGIFSPIVKGREEASMQQAVYSRQEESSFSGQLL